MPAQYAKSIALTPELSRLVDALVASGAYKSASEGMRDGSPALIGRRERNAAEFAEIRMRVAYGLAEADRGDDGKDPAKRLCDALLTPASREPERETLALHTRR